MNGQCDYEFDGTDTDDTKWYKCTTHNELAPSPDAPCAGYIEVPYEVTCNSCKVQYEGGFSGQGFTGYDCKNCGKSGMHHNTATPKLCKDCAVELLKCQRCMGELEIVKAT